jgi:hypothetical protein
LKKVGAGGTVSAPEDPPAFVQANVSAANVMPEQKSALPGRCGEDAAARSL